MTFSEQSSVKSIQESPSSSTTSLSNTASEQSQTIRQLGEAPARNLGEPYLQVENVHKTFGQFVALRDIHLNVYPGEFVCLLGPSGCGKTTLLRIIAGLEDQTSGRIIQAGKDVSKLPAAKRDFGIVFQSYALFPNLTATQNIAYGLQNAKESKQKIQTRVEELLDLVGLESFGQKYPSQMSGGQQQRVALARALALSPGLLLLDEPLSALDAQVRVKLRTEISQLQKRLGITTVMVTHDQSEALAMADRAVVMDKGYIAQVGTPRTIYQHPNTPFVANFIGVMNFLHGGVVAPSQIRCGNIIFDVSQNEASPNQAVTLAIRPEDIQILKPDSPELSLSNVVIAEVQAIEFLGSAYRVTLCPEGNAKELIAIELSIQEASKVDLTTHSLLKLRFPPDRIQVFAT
ncbi:MAG: putative 2-aminoethylphosphonate ABC transporter ATP-binding protein [Timaviella obliquedivisa GSE-PSE-MK23-08B]|jgi:iron(III) transport system ATP-binding protein|nr:putative 2-aminoethylphosphonate ABC transporter ATP-binding protein [Timaviella obliquedivisa GSE-PSE-MK23-08B]